MWRRMWSFKAAFLNSKPRRKMSDAGGASELFPGQMWKRHIVHQLHNRDRNQHDKFRDLIRVYSQLLEKTSLTKVILSCSTRRPSSDSTSLSILMHQKNELKKTTGELAFQVVELQQQIKIKECLVEEQHARLHSLEQLHSGALDSRVALQRRVETVQADNSEVKGEYDVVLERQGRAETRLREEKLTGSLLVEQMVQMKKQQAARMNSRNERKSRAREANLQKELQKAVRSQVTVDSSSSSAPSSRSSSPNDEKHKETRTHTRLFRSSSASSPRILSSIRELFEKRRGHSVSLEEDLMCPMRVCLSARIPTRARHVLEAHEQGINAVSFSCSSDLLATGGTDRVIKLWEVTAGQLTHRATLGGSSGGITCIQFDPQGSRVLAASYDKSALLWRLDDSVPKLTLTGHRRKVTAARFSSGFQTVVTGSADGSIRLWDLHRAACVQDVEVSSFCSDVVCSENCVISGHYDSKIRVWDTRTLGCVQVLPSQDKVTSLDLSLDHRQLLSCCRDDCLQLADLRGRSYDRVCFRAEGFKCGSDSTKAVISPDGCFLAAGGADGAVYIWNVSTGNLETRLPDRHSSSISAVAWSLSGEYFVSVDKSRMAVLWSDF